MSVGHSLKYTKKLLERIKKGPGVPKPTKQELDAMKETLMKNKKVKKGTPELKKNKKGGSVLKAKAFRNNS